LRRVPERLAPGWDRDRVLDEFAKQGIPALSGSCPEIYLEKAFQPSEGDRLPVARELGETSIQFLVHPTLTQEQVAEVAAIAVSVLTEAAKG